MNATILPGFPERLLSALGRNVARFRKQHGWSQETLGFEAGIHRTYICDIEAGKRNSGIVNVAKLAKALGVSVSDLCKDINHFYRAKSQ